MLFPAIDVWLAGWSHAGRVCLTQLTQSYAAETIVLYPLNGPIRH